jgi:hypothetical protein
VETSRPRVWCYSTSELAGGVSMVGTANEQPYRTPVVMSRPHVGRYSASEGI